MSKSAPKLPTIQDLTRDGLLRLIRNIHPWPIKPSAIVTVMADEAWLAYETAKEAQQPAEQRRSEAFDRLYRKKRPTHDHKDQRAYLDADEAAKRAAGRVEAAWRRWHRLSDQLIDLRKQETLTFPDDEV